MTTYQSQMQTCTQCGYKFMVHADNKLCDQCARSLDALRTLVQGWVHATPAIHQASHEQFALKLREEADEYVAEPNVVELADVFIAWSVSAMRHDPEDVLRAIRFKIEVNYARQWHAPEGDKAAVRHV